MAGSLLHGPKFEQVWYTAGDGQRHYELLPRGGDIEVMSNSSWQEVVEYFESLGVPREMWPVCESNIDAPLTRILSQNEDLRRVFRDVTLGPVRPSWADFVFRTVAAGEFLFYCVE
ncbi:MULTISPECIES: hypothetical protein [Sorangium]|uniref:hypothetical protein n=1 Tax=Sorangium TaxID=39643 RepID=UPI00101A0C4C|nr:MULTISPECIES: hypothetical protein [Sorangium]